MRYRDIPPYGLRLQPGLKAKLDAIVQQKKATKPDWSLNAEIALRLEDSLAERNDLAQFNDGELIQELLNRYGRDGIYIRIGSEQTVPSAIQDAVNALNKKLADIGDADHDEEAAQQRNKNC